MHEQDWQEPLTFDWLGANGPPFTQEELHDSVISRILRNDFHAPWEEPIKYVRQKPWWNPNDLRRNKLCSTEFIPGKQEAIPQYPRLSTLTKKQHLSGLKVLSSKYRVQPLNYPLPTPNDYETFEKMKKKYKDEQNEYRLWAKKSWVNGHCIRALHSNPILETVYEAQFEIKRNEIHSLPISYRMSAQISLETSVDPYEFRPIKDLKNVEVTSLPEIEYPGLTKEDTSITRECILPKLCREHPSRYILPDENTPSALPLPEVYRKLAHFAIENGAEIIASESALSCILDIERSWKLHISVDEVLCQEGGGVKKVLVLGNEVRVEKECGAQRTYIAYRHLLRHTFTSCSFPSIETYDDDDQNDEERSSCGSEPNELMDVNEQRRRSTKGPLGSYDDKNNSNEPSHAERSSCGSEPNELMEVNEQRRRSTKGPLGSYYDKNNSNEPSHAERSSCGSEPNELMEVNEQRRRSTKGPLGSYYDKNNSNEPSHAERSSCGSEPNELMEVNEQRRRSTKGPLGSYYDKNNSNEPNHAERSSCGSEPNRLIIDDQDQQNSENKTNSNAPSHAELSSCGSEPNELMDIIEQRRRSSESSLVAFDDTNNRNAPSDAELSSSDSESNRLFIDDEDERNKEFKPEVSVPVKQENYQNEAEFYGKQFFLQLFGTDSEVLSQTETKMRNVSHEEKKKINFAAMYTEIKKAQTSNQITLDTTTLATEAFSDIIGENMSSSENMDDTNCTCKGTMFEVPQRSFKKWKVKNTVSNQGFDVIITSCHKARKGEREVILEPIVEWQPELGACKQSAGRLQALALALMIRPMAHLINVRVDYKNGNIIMIDKLDETTFISRHGDKRSDIADRIHTTINQLRFLKPGQYILSHDSGHGPHAMLYSARAADGVAGTSVEHTLSLRPEKYYLSEVEEATLAKIPPELSRAMLPYHKGQGILPLAFTTDKKHVTQEYKKAPSLVRGRRSQRATQCQKRIRKAKKKPRPAHEI